ncbi:hypothetical protein [Bifidobacterium gallicum]|nr:hypothetical protein [Bifidobacterium gallicum]
MNEQAEESEEKAEWEKERKNRERKGIKRKEGREEEKTAGKDGRRRGKASREVRGETKMGKSKEGKEAERQEVMGWERNEQIGDAKTHAAMPDGKARGKQGKGMDGRSVRRRDKGMGSDERKQLAKVGTRGRKQEKGRKKKKRRG